MQAAAAAAEEESEGEAEADRGTCDGPLQGRDYRFAREKNCDLRLPLTPRCSAASGRASALFFGRRRTS